MKTAKIFVYMMFLFVILLFLETADAQERTFSPTYNELMKKLERLTPGEKIEVKMGTEKDKYYIGDPFEMRFQLNKDSHIVLMDISTNGDITFIVPSAKVPEGKVEGERVYSTLYDYELKIMVAPPIGIETINLFCSPEKLELFEADFEREAFYTIASSDEARLRQLIDRLEQLEKTDWSGNSVSFSIEDSTKGVQRGKFSERGRVLPPISSTGTTGRFFPPIETTGTAGHTEETDKEEQPE